MMSTPPRSSMFHHLTGLLTASLPTTLITTLAMSIVALTGVTLSAHDMWIEPTTFAPDAGRIVGVRLRVGQDLLGDPLAYDPALINQFIFEDATGRKPVVGRAGADPAGLLRVAAPGLLVIGYRSNPSAVELTAEKFNQYLKEEGLDTIAELRARRHETGVKTRELFSRCRRACWRPDRQASAVRVPTAIGPSASRSNLSRSGTRTQSQEARISPSV